MFNFIKKKTHRWSYGILLYEIVTLGSTPYPSVQTPVLLKLLKSGYRMEKPTNCGEYLYETLTIYLTLK